MADASASSLRVRIRQTVPMPLDLAFTAHSGKLTALVGPSGSGKTSTLRTVAGFMRPECGEVRCGDQTWLDTHRGVDVPARRRRVGIVFQSYALFPHMSALQNVTAALAVSAARDRTREGRELLERVHLSGVEHRLPHELSGGQQQRVAVARALARRPDVLLLDEPFSAVDQLTRSALLSDMADLRRSLTIPIVMVTHNMDEVAKLADEVVILSDGRIIAAGGVGDLFARPDLQRYTGAFEASTVLSVHISQIADADGITTLNHAAGRLFVTSTPGKVGDAVRVRIRARDVALAVGNPGAISIRNRLATTVNEIGQPVDGVVEVRLDAAGDPLIARITPAAVRELGLGVGQSVVALIKSAAFDRPDEV